MSPTSRPQAVPGPSREGRDPRNPWAPSAFSRLARAHAAGVAGDALFAIGLAGSVFFSLDFNSARWRVALYLILTIAPFAVAAPLIGPALDRIKGGRRWIIVASFGLRAMLAFLVVRHLDSLLFYPEAFGMLVLGKVYTISKSAVVPGTVRSDEELVEANSKLTVLSALAVVVAAAPAGILLKLGGAGWTLALSGILFLAATVLSFRLAPTTVAEEPAGEAEKEELRGAGIFLAGSAMAVIRGVVGFLSFMLAFAFKNAGAPLWQLGIVAATAQLGFFLGAVAAPRLRRLATEERILVGSLAMTAVGGLVTALLGGLFGAAVLSMLVGATGSAAKQAFDAILQRDAPDANRGRSFARFETRFQLFWVIGALVPIIVPIPAEVGFVVIALGSAAAATWYLVGLRRIRQGRVPVRRRGWRLRPLFGPGAHPPEPATADGGPAGPGIGDALEPGALRPDDPTVAESAPPPTPPPPPVPDPTIVAHDDPTVVTGAGPSSRPAGTDPAGTDPAGTDPARRWMRPTRRGETTVPAPAGRTSPGDHASPGSDAAADAEPAHRGQGLLFGPEAWDDPLPPPDPDATGVDRPEG